MMRKSSATQLPKKVVCNSDPANVQIPAQELYDCAPDVFDDLFVRLGFINEEDRLDDVSNASNS